MPLQFFHKWNLSKRSFIKFIFKLPFNASWSWMLVSLHFSGSSKWLVVMLTSFLNCSAGETAFASVALRIVNFFVPHVDSNWMFGIQTENSYCFSSVQWTAPSPFMLTLQQWKNDLTSVLLKNSSESSELICVVSFACVTLSS